MSRLKQSIIGILAGAGLAVVAAALLFAFGVGPGDPRADLPSEPSPAPGPTEPMPEPVPTMLPEPAPTPLPDPDRPGEPGPTGTSPDDPGDRPAVGYVLAGGAQAYVYVSPNTASHVIAGLPDGAPVYITCTTRGENVSSAVTGAASDLWDYTTLGGYIPDVGVDTGTNEPVRPACPS